MRVISGKYRGRKILPPFNNNVRPTYDKVKEAMFALLSEYTPNSTVIDLFAGTGNLGIEALSRGASKVYFCDNSSSSLEIVKRNTEYCPNSEKELIKGDYVDVLKKLSGWGVKADIILCDPPYGKGISEKALLEIKENDILKEGGVVVIERKSTDNSAKKPFTLVTEKKYGDICLDVYKNISKCAVTGTFDPFTNGHKYIVEKALELFDYVHVVILNNENKTSRYSVDVRKRMIELALVENKKFVRVDYYDGMTVDYCDEYGIENIIRGYRNEKDRLYEQEMADYNEEHGGVKTIILKGENAISSTEVKTIYDNGGDITEFVCDDVKRLMERYK